MQDVFDDVERFDDDFRPDQGRKAGLEVLPDASYDFAILGAVADRTEKTRDPIIRVGLRILGGHFDGQEVEWLWWLTRQEGVDRIGGDLATLGFDTAEWRPPARPFSRELARALPRLQGVRFRGQIKRAESGGKTYVNLYCNTRLAGASPPPPAATTPPVQPAAPRPAEQPAPVQSYGTEEEIPF